MDTGDVAHNIKTCLYGEIYFSREASTRYLALWLKEPLFLLQKGDSSFYWWQEEQAPEDRRHLQEDLESNPYAG